MQINPDFLYAGVAGSLEFVEFQSYQFMQINPDQQAPVANQQARGVSIVSIHADQSRPDTENYPERREVVSIVSIHADQSRQRI